MRSEAPRPKGRGFPVRCFLYIVPLAPTLKSGGKGHLPVEGSAWQIREASSDLKEVAITISKTKNEKFAMVVALDEREREIMKAGGTLAYLKGRA
jgi:hypothetical protein